MKKLLAFFLLTGSFSLAQVDTAWVWLFNGEDLTGWTYRTENWFVQQGSDADDNDEMEITQQGPISSNSFLVLDTEPEDYILEAEIKNHQWNSGIQFRSYVKGSVPYELCGPQADVGQNWSGKIWGECFGLLQDRSAACAADANARVGLWNHHRVQVIGTTYSYWVNNILCVEDFEHPTPSQQRVPGKIGFQFHTPGIGSNRSDFKGIKIMVLKGDVPPGLSYDPRNPPVSGCTDPAADNQDISANLEDNSCTYTGCGDSVATNDFCLNNAEAFPCVESNNYTRADITGNNCTVGIITRFRDPAIHFEMGPSSIKISTSESTKNFKISIFDVAGHLVSGKSGQGKIDANFELQNGIYFIKLNKDGVQHEPIRVYLFQ